MARIRGADTTPERLLARALRRCGLRPRPQHRAEAVRMDLAFPRARLAVFVDGCFWHQCPQHATMPTANRDFWEPKLRRNVERDRENDAALEAMGWTVLRFWEHEDPGQVAGVIVSTVRRVPDNNRRMPAHYTP